VTEFLVGTDRYCRRLAGELFRGVIAAAILATFCSSSYASCSQLDENFVANPHFAAPTTWLADGPPPLVLCHLRPYETIRLTSLMLSSDKRLFSSTQTFRIGGAELNTAKDAPIGGSYVGVEPEGYFWSMTETRDPPREMLADLAHDPAAIVVSAGSLSAKMDRNFGQWLATARDIREDGIVGKLFKPKWHIPARSAVIIIPGAEWPSFQNLSAYLLAARGFTVLSLPYYGLDGLPQQLESIPIEYFSRAIDLLRRDYIGDRNLFLLAISRGAEAAAMTALQRDDIAGLILSSPSSVLNAGWEMASRDR
jgi:Acyl-CoA thioester hydrolase/BAAT N-terminal region